MKTEHLRHCVSGTVLSISIAAIAGCDRTGTVPDRNVVARDADNTAQNAKTRDGGQSTPTDQLENSSDIKITSDIRRELMADSSMSTNAKNCKVITANGTVTLEGVVDTQGEKDRVESKAKAIAGVSAVVNRLQVKSA